MNRRQWLWLPQPLVAAPTPAPPRPGAINEALTSLNSEAETARSLAGGGKERPKTSSGTSVRRRRTLDANGAPIDSDAIPATFGVAGPQQGPAAPSGLHRGIAAGSSNITRKLFTSSSINAREQQFGLCTITHLHSHSLGKRKCISAPSSSAWQAK